MAGIILNAVPHYHTQTGGGLRHFILSFVREFNYTRFDLSEECEKSHFLTGSACVGILNSCRYLLWYYNIKGSYYYLYVSIPILLWILHWLQWAFTGCPEKNCPIKFNLFPKSQCVEIRHKPIDQVYIFDRDDIYEFISIFQL